LVSAGLAQRALVQLSYAIGVAEPLSIFVDTYGTGTRSDQELVEIIRKNFDLRPGVIGVFIHRKNPLSRFTQGVIPIVRQLDLQKPVYRKTASYGHFGVSLFFSSVQTGINDTTRFRKPRIHVGEAQATRALKAPNMLVAPSLQRC